MLSRSALLGVAVAAALLAGCGSQAPAQPAVSGPPGVVRVGLARLPWPLDPARIAGRDELSVARALWPSAASLCSGWRSDDGQVWRARCRHGAALAAALRALPEVEAVGPGPIVRLRFPWRRFPARLETVLVPGAPGPFRFVSGSPDRIVAARPGLRLVFSRLDPRAAVALFRRGLLDEAPVPEGDLRAAAAAGSLRASPILAVDAFVVSRGGVLARTPELLRVYWQTADRLDYAALVPELEAGPAYGVLSGAGDAGRSSPASTRQARAEIPALPQVAVPLAAAPGLADDAALVWAQWRELGLGPELDSSAVSAAVLRRISAAYPEPEALLAPLLSPRDRHALLAAADQRALLRRDDAALQARVIPLAWVVDARLVSPRLQGWREDALGVPDYARVKFRGSSRRR